MKKLNKLQINSEKKLDNEELLSLRGGYGVNSYQCYIECDGGDYGIEWCPGETCYDAGEHRTYVMNRDYPQNTWFVYCCF